MLNRDLINFGMTSYRKEKEAEMPYNSETGKIASNKRKTKSGGKTASLESNLSAKEGEISEIVQNVTKWFGRSAIKTDEEFLRRTEEFFQVCQDNDELPTLEKLCVSLGITRDTLNNWGKGTMGTYRQQLVAQIKETMAAIDAELVSRNKIPQVVYIFRSKNFWGMKDEQQYTYTPVNVLGDEAQKDEIAKLYQDAAKDLPEIEVDAEAKNDIQ